MGVNIKDILIREKTKLESFSSKIIALMHTMQFISFWQQLGGQKDCTLQTVREE